MFWLTVWAETAAAATATAENAHWTAIAAAIVSIVTAAGTLYTIFRKEKRTDENAITKELKLIIARHEKQINRQQTLIDGYDTSINRLRGEHAQCQVRLSDYYGWLLRYHDWMTRQADICRKIGQDPGELPDLPPHPLKDIEESESEVNFAVKTVAQGKNLVREIDNRTVGTNIHGDPPPSSPSSPSGN